MCVKGRRVAACLLMLTACLPPRPPPPAGSIMVTAEESVVIDPEFAFYGPMAFDVAKVRRRLCAALQQGTCKCRSYTLHVPPGHMRHVSNPRNGTSTGESVVA